MARIRKTSEVECIKCKRHWMKRLDCMKNWSGLCAPCRNGNNRRGKYTHRKQCKGCGKISYWIKSQDYCKKCIKPFLPRGDKHHNWKGGITSLNTYQRCRFLKFIQPKIFKRDDYRCLDCGERGGKLQVDHIFPWATFTRLRFDENNCQTLCMACHYKKTFKKELPVGVVWGHNLSHSR